MAGITAGVLAAGAVAKGAADYQGAKKARKAVGQAAGEALDVNNTAQESSLERLNPYAEVGQTGLDQLSQIASGDYSSFESSPDYQFAYDQGQRTVQQGLAGRGLSNSGAAMKELASFGSGLASQNLASFRQQLMNMVGIGQNATNNQVNVEQQTAANNSNVITNKGASEAAALQQQYGAIGDAAASLGNIASTAYGGGFKTPTDLAGLTNSATKGGMYNQDGMFVDY